MENIELEDADMDSNSASGNECFEEVVRAPLFLREQDHGQHLVMDLGMWLNIVNVKLPY